MSDKSIPVVGFAAFSGTGKTTLVRNVIPVLRSNGLRIAVIKHAHHNFVIDTPGKDSYELRKAGADQVLVASRQRIAWVMEKYGEDDPDLFTMFEYLSCREIDLIIVEGYKREPFTKIEVYRSGVRYSPLANQDANVIAVATDSPELIEANVPVLGLDDYDGIAKFIIESMKSGVLTTTDATR